MRTKKRNQLKAAATPKGGDTAHATRIGKRTLCGREVFGDATEPFDPESPYSCSLCKKRAGEPLGTTRSPSKARPALPTFGGRTEPSEDFIEVDLPSLQVWIKNEAEGERREELERVYDQARRMKYPCVHWFAGWTTRDRAGNPTYHPGRVVVPVKV